MIIRVKSRLAQGMGSQHRLLIDLGTLAVVPSPGCCPLLTGRLGDELAGVVYAACAMQARRGASDGHGLSYPR